MSGEDQRLLFPEPQCPAAKPARHRPHPRCAHWRKAPFDVYIGRPSIWGNPFEIGPDGTREEVIRKYRAWIQTRPQLLARLPELKGKTLGCWCAPLPCHGEVLVELSDLASA